MQTREEIHLVYVTLNYAICMRSRWFLFHQYFITAPGPLMSNCST